MGLSQKLTTSRALWKWIRVRETQYMRILPLEYQLHSRGGPFALVICVQIKIGAVAVVAVVVKHEVSRQATFVASSCGTCLLH